MPHPLVEQLRFARSEFARGLEGVTDEEARRRFMPMNSISWMVGHLAAQEQRYWLYFAQGKVVLQEINAQGHGQPASTPPIDDMWQAWRTITTATDPWLDSLTPATLNDTLVIDGRPIRESTGTLLLRVIYHYWFHTGESLAIRQMLGHTNLPEFVGGIGEKAPYRPEI